jgi:splicing factor 3B subunit 3
MRYWHRRRRLAVASGREKLTRCARPQWRAPLKKNITKCAVNQRQVVIALTGGELVFFELDKIGALTEMARKEMGSDVSCLALAPIAAGRRRAAFVVSGSERPARTR